MRRWMWPVALVGLGLGSLSMVGGSAIGGSVGPLAVAYGIVVVLTALYMIVGLIIRDRVARRATPARPPDAVVSIDRLAGRRVF